jgi:SAM-dependent methyltransferase
VHLEDEELRRHLARKCASDARFDVLFPPTIREKSRRFWTPVAVAARAAELFERHGARRVLDVGSGPGKFCLAAAAAAPSLVLTGVEQRSNLVHVAEHAARRLQLSNVQFVVGDVTSARWDEFDGYYFFNPFGENLFDGMDWFDDEVELSERRFREETRRVEEALWASRVGTVMITNHGFGGRIPRAFELTAEERRGSGHLRVWKKRVEGRAVDGYWIEDGVGGVRAAGVMRDENGES